MRIAFLLIVFSIAITRSYAQTDSSAYQTQRLRINALLAERSAKFGQYDESLNSRTGIFGVQTKKDIKNSNEILRQIVLNDNNIFKELKVLLDYKDLEVKQVQNTISNTSGRIEGYKGSVKKLQDQNQLLSEELQSARGINTIVISLLILIIAGIAATIFFVIRNYRMVRR